MSKYYEAWTEYAACREIGGDEWFPEKGGDFKSPRKICLFSCPVQDLCLEQAMRREEGQCGALRYGIVGGMTPMARARHEPYWLAAQAEAAA